VVASGADPDIKDVSEFPSDDLARIHMEDGLVQVLEMIEQVRKLKRKT
jgi:hypothetical protein